ncbi:MAG TPA: thioredoxin family protein [Gemmataceae bacterium]|nr:thioredoxin family protein [Gemmataceae bacterium]
MAFTQEYADQEPSRAEIDALAGPVVVEFGAPWCPHCIAVQSALEVLMQEFPVHHIKIYDGKGLPLGRSFRVKLWPSLVFLRDGNVLRQLARPGRDQMREAFEALAAEEAR